MFTFSDIASLLATHVNNHLPGFFRPYSGRLDDPEDAKSDLYELGLKKKIFNINTSHCI